MIRSRGGRNWILAQGRAHCSVRPVEEDDAPAAARAPLDRGLRPGGERRAIDGRVDHLLDGGAEAFSAVGDGNDFHSMRTRQVEVRNSTSQVDGIRSTYGVVSVSDVATKVTTAELVTTHGSLDPAARSSIEITQS